VISISDFANFALTFSAFASWCNGSTRDSGSLCLGSNPSEAELVTSEQPGACMREQLAAALRTILPTRRSLEAQLAEIEATGVRPTVHLHRAKQMLGCVRRLKASGTKAKTSWASRRVSRRKEIGGKKVSKIKAKGRPKTRSRATRR
jgi:hypothetical protein